MFSARIGRAAGFASSPFTLLIFALLLGCPTHICKAEASDINGDVKRTRFVIGLDRHAQFQVSALTGPNRVFVELPEVGLQLPTLPEGQTVGLVKSIRGGLSAPGKTRVVIDVTAPVVVESAVLERSRDGKSHRLVLEIVPFNQTAAARNPMKVAAYGLGAAGVQVPVPGPQVVASASQPPLPKPAESPRAKAAKTYKPTIVIDPGHGGHDSGAEKFGAVEKDVVLAFAKVLRDKLIASGRYHVLMTRDSDVFVELDDRVEFAERNKAALFIAVHADYANTGARGATIYSLREGVAEDLRRSAKVAVVEKVLSGNDLAAVRQQAGTDADTVQSILGDLAQREVDATRERTSVFTRSVIEYMSQSTNLKDNPDRTATYRVLKTAQFPSVLIELAYVSNKEDAQLLRSGSWRQKVSESIATAVDNYFSNQLARLPM